MKVMVLGATGNVGTAVVERLALEESVTEIVGVARRLPRGPDGAAPAGGPVTWRGADVRTVDWIRLLDGVDAVVVLAWMFQPTRNPDVTWGTNVVALDHLLEALPRTGVSHLVAASSIAAYSPHPSPEPVDERWPTHGASAAPYAREKAYVERLLDRAEGQGPPIARLRPAFVFQRRAASEQLRIFAGRKPQRLLRPELLPILPTPRGLRLQTVHAEDVADAVARILQKTARGPFNLCADEVLWPTQLGEIVGAKPVRVPQRLARAGLNAAWNTRIMPVPPTMYDALLRLPVMSNARAKAELGWEPRHTAQEALRELLEGLASGAGHPTAPLAPA